MFIFQPNSPLSNRLRCLLSHSAYWIGLIIVILLFSGCSDSENEYYTATIAEAKAAAGEAMAECNASAITLALVDGERVICTESLGYADRAAGKDVAAETMFGIGSVSKMFATLAVMKLVEQGSVLLDKPLVTYLRQFSMASPEYRNITVRMLLNHTAGFPGGDMRNSMTQAPFTGYAAEAMDSLKHQRLKHAPGYLNVYSNDGFTMVENLVKEVTGTSYPEYVRQEILKPLGMNNSRYMDDNLPDGSYAKTYTGETPHPYTSLNVYATGGLYSTSADMAKLMMMLINGGVLGKTRILSSNSITSMSEDQTLGTFNPAPSDMFRFGLGWDTVTQPGLSAIGIRGWQKGGAIDGAYGTMFRSTMIIAPDANLGVVVMMASNNISSDAAGKIGERILLRALMDRGMRRALPASLAQNPLPVVAPTTEEQNIYRGFYAASGVLYRLTFEIDHSMTIESRQGDAWTPKYKGFKKRSDGWYAADGDSITALRLLTSSGRGYIEVRNLSGAGHYASTRLIAQRLDARNVISGPWQARLASRWLTVNDDSFASFLDLDTDPGLTLEAVDGLTGYLLAGMKVLRDMDPQTGNRLDGMFLQIPQIVGRDLADVAVEWREESDWLRFGSTLYRPLAGVPPAAVGPTTVTIGSEGFSEWRRLPVSGSISISDASAWRLFDGNFKQKASGAGKGSAVLPGSGTAAYLMLFGTPGSTIHLNLVQ